jgi:hypothetical protein
MMWIRPEGILLMVSILLGNALQEPSSALSGVVTLKGNTPSRQEFSTRHISQSAIPNMPEKLVYDPIEVDPEKHVKWVLVYVKKGLESRIFDIPKEPKLLEFDKLCFKPRVLGIMAGQEIVLRNQDDFLLNMHMYPKENKESNAGLPGKGYFLKRTFTHPEVGIKVKSGECTDLKAFYEVSNAWITVLPHPYYAVTNQDGKFEIKGLPPGKYTLEAWQEHCMPVTRDIVVGQNESTSVNFELEARKDGK